MVIHQSQSLESPIKVVLMSLACLSILVNLLYASH